MRRVGGALRARGIGDGDRVVFALPNSADLLTAMVATLRSGSVLVPLSPTLTDHERAVLFEDAEPSLVVDSPEVLASLFDGPEVALSSVPRSRPMHYTSGTTGRPKGVFSGLLDESEAAALFGEEVELWGFERADRNIVISPLYHSAPLRFASHTLLQGGEVIIQSGFDASALARTIAETNPTTAFVVPTHLQRLFAVGELPSLRNFRLVVHAGAPCPVPVKHAAIEAFGLDPLWEYYGATEGPFAVCPSAEWLERPGTVGRARPHRTLSVDEQGVIWCTPPAYGRWEYWRAPEKTEAAWRESSFTVFDLGRMDDDGYLYLDGRRVDLIITGGVNVYPLEVEQALEPMPGLVEVVVFGVPDDEWGQRVCAAVVGDVDAARVRAYAKERLAPFKVPKDVFVLEELPRTGTGKVQRHKLVDLV